MLKYLYLLCCCLSSWQLTQAQSIDTASPSHTIKLHAAKSQSEQALPVHTLSPLDYTYGYWLNGYRKNPDDQSPDKLAIETGYFGLLLDLAELTKANFGRQRGSDYTSALRADPVPARQLPQADLLIQIASENRIFTATHSITGPAKAAQRLQANRLWESGRYLQNFEIQHLVFEDKSGNQLSAAASLQIVAWPDSLTLTTDITPQRPFTTSKSVGRIGTGVLVADKSYSIPDSAVLEDSKFTLEAWVNVPKNPAYPANASLISKNGSRDQDGHIGFYIRGSRIDAEINLGGGAQNRHRLTESKSRPFQLENWHHLALSYDGANLSFYIDGKLQNSKQVDHVRKPQAGKIQLGKTNDDGTPLAYGNFDQVRLWNSALTPRQLRSHYTHPEQTTEATGLLFASNFEQSDAPEAVDYLWKNVSTRIQLRTTEGTWEKRSTPIDQWAIGESRSLTLNCALSPEQPASADPDPQIVLHTEDGQAIPASFNPSLNAYITEIKQLKRQWATGYTDIRNYDDFTIEINNTSERADTIPFMLYLRQVANITGLVPMLCYEDGTPTGIPVQLSKNWHELKLGSYLRAYTLLPARVGKQRYKLRIVYGFYGTLPSASHAQLSLVGYGGNGRWDQLAIGCWGETICFDVDRSCVDVAVTDVRMLMARTGADGRKWSWTNAGWGGDWLKVNDPQGQRHHPSEFKTAYLAHGPNLTDVRYHGHFGSQHEVDFNAKVQTLRTDDYARTFQTLSYTFKDTVSSKDAWLLKMGRTFNYAHPRFAFGNARGLIDELTVPNNLKREDSLLQQCRIEGEAPFWVSFPGAQQTHNDGKGNGYRALIIRNYQATLAGQKYTQPSISVPVHQSNSDGSVNLDLLLTAPEGVDHFSPGDHIEMELEWITLHREADDYYGPNESYRQHLVQHPNSWKTSYQEAFGNDLQIELSGGQILNDYPIQIQVETSPVTLKITGGIGYVPIRFSGLSSARGYTLVQIINGKAIELDQSVHGNDFWQTDYDAASQTYSRVYNLPLDKLETSVWQLKNTQ
jgi:hypothetical protein